LSIWIGPARSSARKAAKVSLVGSMKGMKNGSLFQTESAMPESPSNFGRASLEDRLTRKDDSVDKRAKGSRRSPSATWAVRSREIETAHLTPAARPSPRNHRP
jgi:hypothetical protein